MSSESYVMPELRVAELRKILNYHIEKYAAGVPEIPDREYDALFSELRELEKEFPQLVTADSQTQRVGEQPSAKFPPVIHTVPMMSLDNTYNPGELIAFDTRIAKVISGDNRKYVAEPKVDGVAITLMYRNGELAYAATRGSGDRGDIITENARTIVGVPGFIRNSPPVLEVRGEVYLSRREFDRINAEREDAGLPVFANPRNSAAGTLKLLDSHEVAKRKLQIFCYAVGLVEGEIPQNQADLLKYLEDLGLPVTPLWKFCLGIEEILNYIIEFEPMRPSLEYDVDGVVIKLNDFKSRTLLGATSHAPRWMIAYKYEPERAQTTVQSIEHSVGRTGVITPVANLDPVQLSGTIVKRASLHNYDEVARKDIRIGDIVTIEKAGEIIPQVLLVHADKRPPGGLPPIEVPVECPACKSQAVKREGEVALRCVNPSCSAKLQGRIIHFASRSCMDIDGLGESLVVLLVSKGFIKSIADIYELREKQGALVELERMGQRSVDNLLSAIDASRNRGLARLLLSLGIPNVGGHVASLLAENFGDIELIMDAAEAEFDCIAGIGPVVAKSVADFFELQPNRDEIAQLKRHNITMAQERKSVAETPVSGKTIVITGTLPGIGRRGAENWVKSLGARPASSVSAKTDFVIAGEAAGSKADKARKLGVPVVTLYEFEELVGTKAPASEE